MTNPSSHLVLCLGPMSNAAAEEYDAAYAATVAAVAYAIAAREEEKGLLGSQQRPPTAASMDEPAAWTTPQSSKSPRTPKRGESLKKKPVFEGIRSSSSRWFTGKEPVNDDYQDEQGGNVTTYCIFNCIFELFFLLMTSYAWLEKSTISYCSLNK